MIESIIGKTKENDKEEDSQWLSVSDLMAGLMMVFLFISIVLMLDILALPKGRGFLSTAFHARKGEF